MKKFVNDTDALVVEGLAGFAAAHADIVSLCQNPLFVARRSPDKNKVAVISGGGSGHEPMHIGFVGRGMLDGACPGDIFTSPTPDQILGCAKAAGSEKGTLFIVKNYAGDSRNFHMANEMFDGDSAIVMVDDDVAMVASRRSNGRRGIAATVIVEKMAGAAAEQGRDLAACVSLAERVNRQCASIGVALSPCVIPASGQRSFEIGADEFEMGVGIHGEPGARRERMKQAGAIAEDMMDALLADLKPERGSEVLLLANGLGATPLLELYLLFNSAAARLRREGIAMIRSLVGNWSTSLDMAGTSLTLCRLDAEMTALWDAPVHTAALRW
jgi:dihydroxyacetone kinase-like protein